jgi:hypothetical protein
MYPAFEKYSNSLLQIKIKISSQWTNITIVHNETTLWWKLHENSIFHSAYLLTEMYLSHILYHN